MENENDSGRVSSEEKLSTNSNTNEDPEQSCDDKKEPSAEAFEEKQEQEEIEVVTRPKNDSNDETEEEDFRKRLSSIVKPESAVSPTEQGDIDSPDNGSPKKTKNNGEVLADKVMSNEHGVTSVKELKIEAMGQDKQILDQIKQQQQSQQETPTNIKRYTDIRGRFSNLLGSAAKTANVNRNLFKSYSEDGMAATTSEEVEFEPLSSEARTSGMKSRSTSVESEDEVIMMRGEPATTSSLPPVPENEDVQKSPTTSGGGGQLLTPPGVMHKVASNSSMKLMGTTRFHEFFWFFYIFYVIFTGVPVTDNDPLGALSNANSPTTEKEKIIQKSATTADLLVKRDSETSEENILGSPFASSSMARSSTMPLEAEDPDGQNAKGGSYFSLSSIKSMTKTGTTRLSSLKKGGSGYLTSAASQWMSPNSKESLTKGKQTSCSLFT